MTRIDFYILKEQNPTARFPFACRLIEKAYQRGHKVYVHTGSEKDAHLMDDLLWTQRDESFIPHNLFGEGPTPPPPIQIGFTDNPSGFNDVLINLGESIPAFYDRFKRVIEIVPSDDELRDKSRENYRLYREKGHELKSHNI